MSRVTDQADQFRRRLLLGELEQMREMSIQWRAVQARLEAMAQTVVDEILRSSTAPTAYQLSRLRRYRELMLQVNAELSKYSQVTGKAITNRIQSVALDAYDDYERLIRTALRAPSEGGPLEASFDRMTPEAVERIVGRASGGPLRESLERASAIGADGMTQQLAQGIALGKNPNQIAYDMIHAGLGQSFKRFATIARTEVMRTHREVLLEGFRQSGIVEGFVRIASKSLRTCIACLVLDGKVYRLDEEFEQHPNCRCQLIPIGPMLLEPPKPQGQSYFESLSETNRRAIMGPRVYDLYSRGDVLWDELVEIHESDDWGKSPRVKSYRDLVEGTNRRD